MAPASWMGRLQSLESWQDLKTTALPFLFTYSLQGSLCLRRNRETEVMRKHRIDRDTALTTPLLVFMEH